MYAETPRKEPHHLLANVKESAEMVKEDLWDLGAQWKTIAEEAKTETARPDSMDLDKPKPTSVSLSTGKPTTT
jgi:hypothetical protein